MREARRIPLGEEVDPREVEVDPREVSALLDRPAGTARALLVLAHGAGAGMEHPFMEALAERLVDRGVAVLRYQLPYMEAGRGRPDRPPVAMAGVRAAVAEGRSLVADGGPLPGAPLFAGGKSFGGRMTTSAAAVPDPGGAPERGAPQRGVSESGAPGSGAPEEGGSEPGGSKGGMPSGLEGVRGLVLVGFPLHPAGRPGTSRGDHLAKTPHPLLFLQGTRDRLAELELLRPLVEGMGRRARLHVVEGADHGFHVLKRSGRTDGEVLDELADVAAEWMSEVAPPGGAPPDI